MKKTKSLPNPYKAKPKVSNPYKEEGKEEVKAPENSLLEFCVWGHEMAYKVQEKTGLDQQETTPDASMLTSLKRKYKNNKVQLVFNLCHCRVF